MTSSPPRSHSQHLAFLAGATAVNAVHTLAEITRASGNLLAGTASRVAHPVGLVAHGARWVGTMAQRRQPEWHLPHRTSCSAPRSPHLRDFTRRAMPTPTSCRPWCCPRRPGTPRTVVDFSPAQSQLAVIRAAGLVRLYALEWRAATAATTGRRRSPTTSTSSTARSSWIGGRANLVGDCQGGWLAAIYAALHPERVHTLTLAGAPIDFHAGESVIAASTRALTTRARAGALPRAGGRWRRQHAGPRGARATSSRSSRSRRSARQLQLLENLDDAAPRRALPGVRGLVQAHPGHPRRVLPVARRAPVLGQRADRRATRRRRPPRPISRTSPARCSCSPAPATTSRRRRSSSPPPTRWAPRRARSSCGPRRAGTSGCSPAAGRSRTTGRC